MFTTFLTDIIKTGKPKSYFHTQREQRISLAKLQCHNKFYYDKTRVSVKQNKLYLLSSGV